MDEDEPNEHEWNLTFTDLVKIVVISYAIFILMVIK